MKHFYIPLRNGSLQLIFSTHIFRKYKYLRIGLCGKRKRTRHLNDLEGRIKQTVVVTWRWLPFFEYLYIKDGLRKYTYFSNDPLPLKCFIEYEFWKDTHESFDRAQFLTYMSEKMQLSRDEIVDACNDVMLNLWEQHKDKIDSVK